MTSRAEQIAECLDGGSVLVAIGNVVSGTAVKDAAARLACEGELFESLLKLVERWRGESGNQPLRNPRSIRSLCADELSALLEENKTCLS